MRVKPVVLCGGSGNRLWPLSIPDTPKQFITIGPNNETLLSRTLNRLKNVENWSTPILATNV
ncbi:sugar phosphate nucleotidyltransferase [Pseudomonas bubulae]|uniref:sugar phosphate nucleotidyltransferase n=1 Tax=Pseudomonas bubulae TaxID=2316085 RepID=UPI003B00D779